MKDRDELFILLFGLEYALVTLRELFLALHIDVLHFPHVPLDLGSSYNAGMCVPREGVQMLPQIQVLFFSTSFLTDWITVSKLKIHEEHLIWLSL